MVDQRERSCEAVDVIAREHLAEVERKLADLAAPVPRADRATRAMSAWNGG